MVCFISKCRVWAQTLYLKIMSNESFLCCLATNVVITLQQILELKMALTEMLHLCHTGPRILKAYIFINELLICSLGCLCVCMCVCCAGVCCTWLRCRVSDWLGASSGCVEALASAMFGGVGPGTLDTVSLLSVSKTQKHTITVPNHPSKSMFWFVLFFVFFDNSAVITDFQCEEETTFETCHFKQQHLCHLRCSAEHKLRHKKQIILWKWFKCLS